MFGGHSTSVQAQTISSEQNRLVLLQQIERLLTEVRRLQSILAERTGVPYAYYTPYNSVFFPLRFESIYLVQNGQLFLTDKFKGEKPADMQLFDLFTAIVGKGAVEEHVREWRVFENKSNDLGAFVELMAGTDDWIVGVNRENFSQADTQTIKAFANLFVHEYAHIVLFDKKDMTTKFASSFWTSADTRHANLVAQASERNRFTVLRRYFDDNNTRFVSDYATLSPDEDMAETFVSFVREPKPAGATLRDRKILFYYEYKDFVDLRTELRANLQAKGVL